MGDTLMRRNVVLLSAALALGMSVMSLMIATAPLAGRMLAGDSLATLPVALAMIGLMSATVPASLLMQRIGRRAGFAVGLLLGMSGSATMAWSVWGGSFLTFCVGAFLLGNANAFVQYYRFAAAEVAAPEFRSRAISLVMAGGVVAAIIGPNVASMAKDLLAPVPFAGTFAAAVGLQILALVAVSFLAIPRAVSRPPAGEGRPLREIVAQPRFIVAVVGAAGGYGIMSLVMTATPLAVTYCGFTFADSAFVIQWHVLGMYVPSFFTGHLIRRFGELRVMAAGVAAYAASISFNLTGVDLMLNFWPGLILLGVGWNFLFVGGTSLLTHAYRETERARAQGLNDFLVFGTTATASLSAGALHATLGWQAVNLAVLPLLAVIAAMMLWLRLREARVPA